MGVDLEDGECLADFEVHLECEVLVFVVQVEALGEETVLGNIVDPYGVAECLGQA